MHPRITNRTQHLDVTTRGFFNGGAPGRNISHITGDSGFDHEAWKLGVFIGKGMGLGEELARFHMIGSFKHQQTVRADNI